jgi:hypothetical protein
VNDRVRSILSNLKQFRNHTPGPWGLSGDLREVHAFDENLKSLGRLERHVDLLLMAAAPYLLEAVNELSKDRSEGSSEGMTSEEFCTLDVGDVVRHVTSGDLWVVSRRGSRPGVKILVRTCYAMNPPEWRFVRRSKSVE